MHLNAESTIYHLCISITVIENFNKYKLEYVYNRAGQRYLTNVLLQVPTADIRTSCV